jgi:TRAP-type C4-dicarboxylate transport system permease small subunit
MREKSHIGIDLIVRALGHRNRLILETLLTALILAFLAALTIEGVRLTVMNSQRQFGDSGISYAWVTFAVPAGCVMLAAALIYNLIGAWRRRGDGRTLVYSRSEGDAPSVTEL